MSERIKRRGARVLVVDDQDRVLLLRGFDPMQDRPPWWFTPGGGVDDGESDYSGALRELYEETGFAATDLEGPVWFRTTDFDFMGLSYTQDEVFYFLRVEHFTPVAAAWTKDEKESMLDAKWWELDELELAIERVYPQALPRELRKLLADGLPAQPYDVGY
jgi:8-oxo-dGTP pyrophosphatase MutT (NUDIX family)